LSANYGIYGPTYELMESVPREPGSEEYRDSEKYQLRNWPVDRQDSLWPLIARLNRIRRENPALQSDRGLRFCDIDNDQLIAYLKMDASAAAGATIGTAADGGAATFGNVILTVVNLDPQHAQSGWLVLDLAALRTPADQPYQLHDLLSDQRYVWRGRRNYVQLDPRRAPAHVFKLRWLVRSERDFDYYT
jgi:starch synthase (maltosyl-transferring)